MRSMMETKKNWWAPISSDLIVQLGSNNKYTLPVDACVCWNFSSFLYFEIISIYWSFNDNIVFVIQEKGEKVQVDKENSTLGGRKREKEREKMAHHETW